MKKSARKQFEFLREMQAWCKELGLDETTSKVMIKIKREIRSDMKELRDPIAQSIMEEQRRFYPRDDGESWHEYIIYEDNGETDEDINEFVDGMRMQIHSMYDCTGKPFTASIHWSRQPAGIVVVHRLALDV